MSLGTCMPDQHTAQDTFVFLPTYDREKPIIQLVVVYISFNYSVHMPRSIWS